MAELYRSLDDNGIECRICRVGCTLRPIQDGGKAGLCGGYENDGGTFCDLTYGKITAAIVTQSGWAPVSELSGIPVDTNVLSVGSRGCNFRCRDCFNQEDAFARHDREGDIVLPNNVVEYALAMGCKGVAANFNEGLLAVNYWKDIFEKAKEAGMHTIAVSNGYSTREALDVLCGGGNLDVYRVDIKGIRPETLKRIGNGHIESEGVLDSLTYVKQRYPKVHIEVVTLLRDWHSDDELREMGCWIRDNLGEDTPWHISPTQDFTPAKKTNAPPAYIRDEDLFAGGRVTTMKVVFLGDDLFEDGDLQLRIGDWSADMNRVDDYPGLDRGVKIARAVGLKNVFAKIDGH